MNGLDVGDESFARIFKIVARSLETRQDTFSLFQKSARGSAATSMKVMILWPTRFL